MENTQLLGAGRTLFKQGEKGGDLYFIKTGSVNLMVMDAETGAEFIVATVGERSVIGTMSFLEGDPRSATAIAKTDIEYVLVNQAQRDKLLKTVPPWFQVLVKDLASSLRRTNDLYVKANNEINLLKKKNDVREKHKKEADDKINDLENKMNQQRKESQEEVAKLKEEIKKLKDDLAKAQAGGKK